MTTDSPEAKMLRESLSAALTVCARLTAVHTKLASIFPMTASRLSALTDEESTRIDAMFKRFENLEDMLAKQVFRLVLSFLAEPYAELTQIDIFNRMEKLGIISSAAAWRDLTRIRNRLAHEYPTRPDLQARLINSAGAGVAELKATVERLQEFCAARGLISS